MSWMVARAASPEASPTIRSMCALGSRVQYSQGVYWAVALPVKTIRAAPPTRASAATPTSNRFMRCLLKGWTIGRSPIFPLRSADRECRRGRARLARAARVYRRERLLDGDGLHPAQMAGAVLGDDHAVLGPDAELAVDVDARLVGEGHPGLELEGVALDQIGVLVAFQPDAVAEPVGEVLVAGAEARVFDDLAGGGVHRLAGRARPGGLRARRPGLCGRCPRS